MLLFAVAVLVGTAHQAWDGMEVTARGGAAWEGQEAPPPLPPLDSCASHDRSELLSWSLIAGWYDAQAKLKDTLEGNK